MHESSSGDGMSEAESEFRRRLAAKLKVRGYEGAALERKIEELLRKPVGLRLNLEEILGNGPLHGVGRK